MDDNKEISKIDLGMRLKLLRKQKGLTQAQAAKLLGVDRSTIRNWEANHFRPNADNVAVIAREYGTTPEYILDVKKVENTIIIDGLSAAEFAIVRKVAEDLAEELKKLRNQP